MSVPTSTNDASNQASVDHITGDRHCVFRCHASWFALPATSVREVACAPELSVIPGSHASLAGLCHLRSEFLPVIRIESLLREATADHSDDQKLLVLESSTGPWAILISEVAALVVLETLSGGDANGDDAGSLVVMGTAMHGDEVVRVLDPHRLQRWAQTQLDNHWQDSFPNHQPAGIQ